MLLSRHQKVAGTAISVVLLAIQNMQNMLLGTSR